MPRLRLSVAIAPDDPLPGAELVRGLRALRSGHEIDYPAALERHVLAAAMGRLGAGCSGGQPLPRSLADGSWIEGSDALLIPALTPVLIPTARYALDRNVPVLAAHTPFAHQVLGMAARYPEPSCDPHAWERSLVSLLADPLEREHHQRRVSVQLRRMLRESGSAAEPVTAAIAENDARPAGPGVSVIIPTVGGERVHRCVDALRLAAGALDLQLILSVTGGTIGSLPACQDLVRAERPFCWSRATNAGLRVAHHPFVLLLNDDCYFRREKDLERLVRRLEYCGHLMALAPAGRGFPAHWEQSTVRPGDGLRETRFTLCGACVLVRREAFAPVGFFDERFATYGCDEVDWFYRARAQGYRWAIDADVRVEHEWAATYGHRRERELPESLNLFHRIHGVESVDGTHWNRPGCEVSWIIASRNGAGHLARSLGSVAASRELYPSSLEVVLALDGSTDSSAEVAREFNASLPEPLPLRVVHFPEGAGSAARAKNRALRLALGDIHLPLDDDDAALPARAQLLPALQEGADVAVGDFWVIGLDGSVARTHVAPVTFQRLSRSCEQNWGPWATAIRAGTWREFGVYREDLPCDEDLDLWLRWLRDGVRFTHVPVPVHLYLLRPHSVVFRHDSRGVGEQVRSCYRAGWGAPRLGAQAFAAGTVPDWWNDPSACDAQRPWQSAAELDQLLERVRALRPQRVLEIGTARGGTLKCWLDHVAPGATVVSVDLYPAEDPRDTFATWCPPGVSLHCLKGDSHSAEILARVRELVPEIDFLFLDGDHSYEGVRADWLNYGPLVRPGGIVAFHDIIATPDHSPIQVHRLWQELCAAGREAEELIDDSSSGRFGIGVITMGAGE